MSKRRDRRDREPGAPHGQVALTGSGASTAAHARTLSRLTLRVWVRGKSGSGQRRQATEPGCISDVAADAEDAQQHAYFGVDDQTVRRWIADRPVHHQHRHRPA